MVLKSKKQRIQWLSGTCFARGVLVDIEKQVQNRKSHNDNYLEMCENENIFKVLYRSRLQKFVDIFSETFYAIFTFSNYVFEKLVRIFPELILLLKQILFKKNLFEACTYSWNLTAFFLAKNGCRFYRFNLNYTKP